MKVHNTAGVLIAAGAVAMVAGPVLAGGMANDDCANATPLASNTVVAGDLTSATIDGATSCDGKATNQDAWYSFHSQCTGVLLVTTCGTNDGPGMDQGMDTVLSIHSECPGGEVNELACNDNWSDDDSSACDGDDGGSLRDSAIALPVAADETVFIRVSHADTELGNGTFVVNVRFTQVNDDCVDAIDIVPGSYDYCTVGASTDGPPVDEGCAGFGDEQVGSDIWYRYQATCNGTATAGLCGSNYDTKMAVYGGACPTDELPLACNDDFCGTPQPFQSQVTFDVTAGSEYLIRVGGFAGTVGDGTLDLTVEPNCSGDLDGNGEVNVDDLVAVIVGWGGSSADANCDGAVNVDDLVAIVVGWGPCN